MITCKKDLVNTYIENDNGVLRDVYVSLCRLHGVKTKGYIEYDILHVTKTLEQHGVCFGFESRITSKGKRLTLTDLLPTSYENTKVYSLDEDVIRKYAELCGVEYNHRYTDDEEVGICKVNNQGFVDTFIVGSFVDIGAEYTNKTLTAEQILAAWDLRFKKNGESKMIDLDTLKNGYVSTGDEKLARMFLIECLKHDELNAPIISTETLNDWGAIAVSDHGTPCGHDSSAINGKIELTEDDFNPPKPTRTKVEYVKCEFEKLSDLVLYIESEEMLYTKGCNWCEVGGMHDAIRRYGLSQPLYRRAEVEISERDLFIEEIGKLVPEFDKRTNKMWIGKIYDSGKFKLID